MVIINLQDFNMVKIESRPQILSIRQAFLNGGENHSGKRIWCLVRVGSSPTAPTKCSSRERYIGLLATFCCGMAVKKLDNYRTNLTEGSNPSWCTKYICILKTVACELR